ncbi:golgin subfamily A member 8B-like isoform X2 [Callithrix jacchus]|uniref:golgin subfamily A member 6A-like isoform X2 n=1 Tax=Callithrix jacchus TaxID=9483 RepID=UPI0023DD4F3C|nr:golgin subfamily A member 6A-like isoform X2 [Callithrix jacchus]
MWPQPHLPLQPHLPPPSTMSMSEEIRKMIASARKKLKEFQQRNSPAAPSRVRRRKKRNNSSRETSASDGCQSPCHSAAGGHKEGPAPCATMKDPEPSSRREAVLEQQVQQFLQERELLKAQVAEVTECLKKAQLERDAYAQQLKTQKAQWQQKILTMAGEIEIFKMEKSQDAMKIEKLKGSLAHLQNLLAEPPILKHRQGPLTWKENLKTETKYLRDEPREQERLQEAKMRLWETEVPFLNAAKASAQEEQARLCEQLQKQQVCCQHQAQLGASALKEPEAAATATGTGSESGCGETQRALQGALDQLQRDFMDILKENSYLKERVEKLELGFIQLSGERDMIRKSVKPNDRQRAVAKTQHQKNDVSMLSQAEEGMKVKLLELQGPVMQLMIDHEVQHPANEPTPGAPAPQEPGAADKDELCEVILADSLQPAGGRGTPEPHCTADGTWLCELQDSQQHRPLGSSPSTPCFYQAVGEGAGKHHDQLRAGPEVYKRTKL